jgi:site-specific DNA-cytosine methylase
MHFPLLPGDIFSGAGGFSVGFEQAGCVPAFAVESHPTYQRTFQVRLGAVRHVMMHVCLLSKISEFVCYGI